MTSPENLDRRDIATLLRIMEALRDPKTGCPWDVEQTFATIAPYTIEEAHEVADAIDRGDMEELRKELGDLLLQVVFHARMAEEAGHFSFPDVVQAICDKMIFRHPHVFGAEEERGRPAPDFWERAKAAERAEGAPSPFGELPQALPALMRAQKLQKLAARIGLDWENPAGVAEKVCEEAAELAGAAEKADREAVEEELGDLLFSVVNLARHLGVDAETALRRAGAKFERRARKVAESLRQSGAEEADARTIDHLWRKAKEEEG